MKERLNGIQLLNGALFALQQELEEDGRRLTQETVNGNRAMKAASDVFRARVALGDAEDMVLKIMGVRGG